MSQCKAKTKSGTPCKNPPQEGWIPYVSKDPSEIKITTRSGEVFYAHNVKEEYRHDKRAKVITNFASYIDDANSAPSPKENAYIALLWYLFGDYLNAYSFDWVNPYSKKHTDKDLYVVRNSLGFIKVGVSKNVDVRLVDLSYEFEGEWEVLRIYKGMGGEEERIHEKLTDYFYPVKKRHTGKFSHECFEDCEAVLDICMNLKPD